MSSKGAAVFKDSRVSPNPYPAASQPRGFRVCEVTSKLFYVVHFVLPFVDGVLAESTASKT